MALTHGIYGAGSNWRSIARKLNERRPEWGVVLVDLRQHGKSEPGEPPHTLAACADDMRALLDELGDVRALGGHSFGGKVALATRPQVELDQLWVLDASPSARREAAEQVRAGTNPSGNTVIRVLDFMARGPRSWPTREAFVTSVVDDGHDIGLARWLAMNLVGDAGGSFALRLDVDALRGLLVDYFSTDLWEVLETPGCPIEIVAAERGSALSPADRGRLAAAPPHVHVHDVAAGHWLHIDAPNVIVDLFAAHLP